MKNWKWLAAFTVTGSLLLSAGCGGGGGGGGGGDGSTEGDGSNPVTPTEPPRVVSACPAIADTAPTPTNSVIKLKFSDVPSEYLAAPPEIELICDRVAVDGSTHWEDKSLTFRPVSDLPAGTSCNFSISSRRGDSSLRVDYQQDFTVGDGREFEPAFRPPIVLNTVIEPGALESVLVEGNTVAILSVYAGEMKVMVSRDGGKSFEEPRVFSAGVPGSVQWTAAEIHDGELYIAWTVLPSFSSRELIYTRSDNRLTTFRTPSLVSDPYDDFSSALPSLVVTDENEVFLAWGEECAYGVYYCDDRDSASIRIAGIDGPSGQMNIYDELSRGGSYAPHLVDDEGEILIAWMDEFVPNPVNPSEQRDYTVRVSNYSQGMNEYAQIAFSSYGHPAQFNSFLKTGPAGYHLSWNQSPYQGARHHYAATLDSEYTLTAEGIPLLIDTETNPHSYINRPVSNGKGLVAWVESVVTDYTGVDDYILRINNSNSGMTSSHELDDISSSIRGEVVKDEQVELQLHGNNEIHLAWIREDLTGLDDWIEDNPDLFTSQYPGKSILYSRGNLGSPCAN